LVDSTPEDDEYQRKRSHPILLHLGCCVDLR
jgi:hypothetical protein